MQVFSGWLNKTQQVYRLHFQLTALYLGNRLLTLYHPLFLDAILWDCISQTLLWELAQWETLISTVVKGVSTPWCLKSPKAQLPNVACAWRLFPNAMLSLGIGYKTFKTLFSVIGRNGMICKVGRLLCRRIPHSVMVLLFICQDPNCLFYPQMPI